MSQSLDTKDHIGPILNVSLVARDIKTGRVVHKREGHNVFVNRGRNWLRNHCSPLSFTGLAMTGGINLNDTSGPSRNAISNYKPRWMGLGVGGALQHWTDPGPGDQVESVLVENLESPIAVSDSYWLKEVLPNGLPDDDLEGVAYPDDYILRLRGVFDLDDVSYTPSPGYESRNPYNTLVPVSEVALFTSEADPAADPGLSGGIDGFIAYHVFATIPKTPGIILEVDWDLRF